MCPKLGMQLHPQRSVRMQNLVQAGWNGQARARPRGPIDLQARETAEDIDPDSSEGRTFHVRP